ncbi:hypothetical protein LMG18096_03768 [Ralstonia holmesii]|uniref:Bro-N domain-containing protein n=1 Tax=Ralstonia holmesii TaxID=3058602 RepID=A0ABC8QLW2_9RALS|nr:hypothetical protein LMG18096_03768 [Ralstonia sp. LMG 32967]CAJ0818883.1 hypothetical protein LMG18093_03843 [Ralstonia sp. LMG 32967]
MAGVPAHNHHQTFEGIKLLDDDGSEFWFARELAPLLDYPRTIFTRPLNWSNSAPAQNVGWPTTGSAATPAIS